MLLRRHHRPGLSLLEVLVAMSIFLLALTGLGFLLNVSGNIALDAKYRTVALTIAQARLGELACGAAPLETGAAGSSNEDDPDFDVMVDVQPVSEVLYNATVIVTRKRPDGSQFELSLSQMILEPTLVGSTNDQIATTTRLSDPSSDASMDSSSGSSAASGSSSSDSSGSSGSTDQGRGGMSGGGTGGGGRQGGMGGGGMGGGGRQGGSIGGGGRQGGMGGGGSIGGGGRQGGMGGGGSIGGGGRAGGGTPR